MYAESHQLFRSEFVDVKWEKQRLHQNTTRTLRQRSRGESEYLGEKAIIMFVER
jgi:hypothetical protein